MPFKHARFFQLKKIDAIIVIVLIVIAGLVLSKTSYVSPTIERVIQSPTDTEGQEEPEPEPEPLTPPESIIPGYMRAVSPEDEGLHFDKMSVCREWWYYSAIFDTDSELAGWVVSISFNHMARSDLLGTQKPDLFVLTLHGPNGEEYGGMINKERGLGILQQPTLQAKTPGVSVSFENSWAEGDAPEWFVHAENGDIDKHHEIIVNLRFFAPYDPIWTIGDRAFEKTKSNLASYVFLGCIVTGSVKLDGREYQVKGTGHHEHAWSPNVVTKGLIKGWDWATIALDNGWMIYYANYYPTPQYISTKTVNVNPFGTLILTTNDGKTLTSFADISPEIIESDDEIFTFVKMPMQINIEGKPGIVQPLLGSYSISLNLDISLDNVYENVWKFPTYVGMNVGRSTVKGTLSWIDDDGQHSLAVQGIGTSWNMRAFL
jgi:hypothetical protein